MFIGLALVCLLQSQQPPSLIPIYQESERFLPAQGEKLRLGLIWRNSLENTSLVGTGVSALFFSTDPWSSPTSGGLLDFIAPVSASLPFVGLRKGVAVFTTFPAPEEFGLIGEGAISLDQKKLSAWSLWNPERIRWSAAKMGTVNRTISKLDAVSVGVYGEFGNASQFTGALTNNASQTAQFLSRSHAAVPMTDWWCGDSLAKSAWAKALRDKHGSVERAISDWMMPPPPPPDVPFPVTADFPYAARLEFSDWYRAGVSSAVSSLSDVAGEIFKKSQIMIPVGFGTDFVQQANDVYLVADALRGNACLKATSVCYYDFATNWALSLGRIRGASRATGRELWAEAGAPDAKRGNQVWFEAAALGASGVSAWPEQILEVRHLQPFLRVASPRCDVAILYPSSTQVLRPQQPVPPLYFRGAVELRDYLDFDVLDESAVMAGALANYRVAVLLEGSVWRTRTLQQLKSWVNDGGVLTSYDFGKMSDPAGSTAIWQELFDYASQLAPVNATSRWKGNLPGRYRLLLTEPNSESLLAGKWGAVTDQGRSIASGAELTVPVRPQSGATITFQFAEPDHSVAELQILLGGKKQAAVSVGPAATRFQIVLDRAQTASGNLTIGFAAHDEKIGLVLKHIDVAADESAELAPLFGGFESAVSTDQVKAWTKGFGKGLTIFVPAKKESWREYVSAVRNVVYRLSKISDGRMDAKNIDDLRDGVYACDLGDAIVLYNSNAFDITKPEPSEISLLAHELKEVRINPPVAPIVLECAAFESLGKTEQAEVNGERSVHVPANSPISTAALVKRAGSYRVFVRATHSGVLAPTKVTIQDTELSVTSSPTAGSEFAFAGEIVLPAASVKISLQSEVEMKAFQVVLVNEKLVVGYRIAKR